MNFDTLHFDLLNGRQTVVDVDAVRIRTNDMLSQQDIAEIQFNSSLFHQNDLFLSFALTLEDVFVSINLLLSVNCIVAFQLAVKSSKKISKVKYKKVYGRLDPINKEVEPFIYNNLKRQFIDNVFYLITNTW